jgi:hypothetical protein
VWHLPCESRSSPGPYTKRATPKGVALFLCRQLKSTKTQDSLGFEERSRVYGLLERVSKLLAELLAKLLVVEPLILRAKMFDLQCTHQRRDTP